MADVSVTPEIKVAAPPAGSGGLRTRVTAFLNDDSDLSAARRVAGSAFLIRIGGAAIVYLSQVLLARWMGAAEFGLFVYAWTWVLLSGDLIHMGLASAAPRLIPEYTKLGRLDRLRGFLAGSQWLVTGMAGGLAVTVAALVEGGLLGHEQRMLVLFACLALPFYALTNMLDGLARSYNWISSALLPPYFIRPLILVAAAAALHAFGAGASATAVMGAAAVASILTAAAQGFDVNRRISSAVPPGEARWAARDWFATSLPIFLVWSFFTLLTYTDILVLKAFRPAEDVALYFAATKTLALVAFIYFSVSAAVGHKIAEYHVDGRRDALAELLARATAWTFWPSLAATLGMIALGLPVLRLFGPDFAAAYPVMFVSALGLLARASVGPAERLLNMVGQQRACAGIYAVTFAVALCACFLLIPSFGIMGAAFAMAAALVCESSLLFVVIKRRTGLHAFVLPLRRNVEACAPSLAPPDAPEPAPLEAKAAPAAPAVAKRATAIRPFEAHDAGDVAALFHKTFLRGSGRTSPALGAYLTDLYLGHPWHDPALASRVCVDGIGAVRGFIGILPVRMTFEGRPILAAAAGSLMVDDPERDPLAGARLLRAFFSGPQQLSFSETSNPLSETMWHTLGGETVAGYSLEWLRVFRPARFAIAAARERLPLARFLSPLAGLGDRAISAVTGPWGAQETCAGQARAAEIDTETFNDHLLALAAPSRLRPDWARETLAWQMRSASQKERYGAMTCMAVTGKNGRVTGCYAFHGKPGGIAVVLQAIAQTGGAPALLDTLFADLDARGYAAVRGRSTPDLLTALLPRRCLFLHRSSMTVRSADTALLQAIRSGDALMTGLAGESWTRLIGGSFD